jgi:putative membrane protein
MAGHILLMNLLAPAVAVWILHSFPAAARPARRLGLATLAQVLLLWSAHAPPVLSAAMDSPVLHAAMLVLLTVAALWFWTAVVGVTTHRPWRAIAALLSTSKLFCLLGVLLTFAAHPLYPGMALHGGQAMDPLADQQLAGLMMLIACPLSYLVAAVVLASRGLLSDQAPEEGGKVA